MGTSGVAGTMPFKLSNKQQGHICSDTSQVPQTKYFLYAPNILSNHRSGYYVHFEFLGALARQGDRCEQVSQIVALSKCRKKTGFKEAVYLHLPTHEQAQCLLLAPQHHMDLGLGHLC